MVASPHTLPSRRGPTAWLGDLPHLWDLIAVLVHKHLKLRYRGTTLGILWSLTNPLAFALVLHFAFQRIFRLDIENYALFILSALFPWQWLSNSINQGPGAFIASGGLIRKLRFPKLALGVALVLGDMIHFLVTIPVFVLLLVVYGGDLPDASWLVGIPALLLIQSVHLTAIVLIIATVNAILRDLEHLVQVLMLLLFYVTPILYSVSMIPANLWWVPYANPVAPLLTCWRTLLTEHHLGPYLPAAVAHMLLTVAVAVPVYRRWGWRVPEVV
jgi:lipopolysaccharide transport system permease protein